MRNFFTRSAVLLSGAATGLTLAAAPAAFADTQVHQVVYRVYGPQVASLPFGPQPGSLADIAYKTPDVEKKAKTLALPWIIVFQARGGDAELASKLRIDVTRTDPEDSADGVYRCEISVDGEIRASESSDLDGGALQCVPGVSSDD